MKFRITFFLFLLTTLSWGQATLPVNRTTWTTTPIGWTDSGTTNYTTTFACDVSATGTNNSGQMNQAAPNPTNDYYQVFFSGTPNTLSFVTKATAITPGCILAVEQSPDGATWAPVVNLLTANFSTTCITHGPYTLTGTTRYIRWTYTRGGTVNLVFDDVNISAVTSNNSDIVGVTASEAPSVSSTINNNAPLTSATGVQVWQFKVRDGGATLNDADGLPTILNALTIAKSAGNAIATWSDAINTVALFDGSTFIATGTVTANTIAFTGLSGAAVTVADNTEKTFSLRLSLRCPLLAGALDGEDFGFSVTNANTTFSPSGSGKTTFPAVTSANTGENTIAVVATRLAFSVNPPATVGMNGAMNPSVRVIATDACGNLDLGYTGTISITSSGIMNPSPQTASATAGLAIFNNIIHTATGSGLILTANASGLTSGTSSSFTVTNTTALQPGDIAILAFNYNNTSSEDEISFITFVDILPGTVIDVTDNAYRKCGSTNGWGYTEGWIRLQKTNTTLPRGTVVTVRVSSTSPTVGVPTVVSGDAANWLGTKPAGVAGNFNMNSNGEQIFFMTGGSIVGFGSTTPANADTGSYTGYFVSGFNTKGNVWIQDCNSGTSSSNSQKPDFFDCFLAWPTASADRNKYTGPTTPANKRQWMERINLPSNWTGYGSDALYNGGPNFAGAVYTVNTGGFTDGVWIGDVSTNWFDCSNWQSLKVPDATIDVTLDANSTNKATVDASATYASLYGSVARCKDLSVSTQRVEAIGSASNILTVSGNVNISGSGIVSMDDSNSGTADGQINVAGNWTNNVGSTGFQRGNGTVTFNGVAPQVITSVATEGTESFYNLVLDNDFTTSVSHNIIAKNNLTVNANRSLTISPTNYVEADMNFTNNGTVTIRNSGTLYQSNDAGTNNGNITMERETTINRMDYVYWCSPVENFPVNNIITGMPTGYIFKWGPKLANPNGGLGFWETAAGNTMLTAKGYIAKGPASLDYATPSTLTAIFNGGKPNNGALTYTISRGAMTSLTLGSYNSANGVPFTVKDDNWNLVGNPYPSAINAITFLQHNTTTNNVIEGSVRLWTHTNLPISPTNPFYNSYTYNYLNDYITYNASGSQTGPATFNGNIGSGQGFFVIMNEGNEADATLQFNNSMRVKDSNPNAQFYRTASPQSEAGNDTSRIWIDLIGATGSVTRTLVAYTENATNEKDNMYDAVTMGKYNQDFYSLINGDAMCIQGRPSPVDPQDQVRMGVKIPNANSYKIAIAYVDGVFENQDQDIFLEDKSLGLIHNLRVEPYTFSSEAGQFDARFILRYNDSNLGTTTFDAASSVAVVSGKEVVKVKSYAEKMAAVTIYDILGRIIFEKNEVNDKDLSIPLAVSQQTLIVKIKLASGQEVTKKIAF